MCLALQYLHSGLGALSVGGWRNVSANDTAGPRGTPVKAHVIEFSGIQINFIRAIDTDSTRVSFF